jgi:acetyl-CoA carboxylase biotin carboxyl carrier protein
MDIGQIEKLMKLMQAYGFQELGWEKGDEKIRLVQSLLAHPSPGFYPPPSPAHLFKPNPIPEAPEKEQVSVPNPKHKEIRSPFVGTFYGSSTPGSEPFVQVGSRVKKGDTLCIVEAMKLMNEIEAEQDGVIVEILIKNEQPVEYDQPLFLME